MSNNHRHKKKNNHPKPQTLIDNGSTYSPNSIGGRIDLQALRDKLFCQALNEINETQTTTNHNTDEHSEKSLQRKGKAK
jgi:hypothetical protein